MVRRAILQEPCQASAGGIGNRQDLGALLSQSRTGIFDSVALAAGAAFGGHLCFGAGKSRLGSRAGLCRYPAHPFACEAAGGKFVHTRHLRKVAIPLHKRRSTARQVARARSFGERLRGSGGSGAVFDFA
jgi:hypothetical protein